MPRSRRLILLSLTAFALVASGCGQDEKAKITQAQANKLAASLDRAEEAFDETQCGAARAAAQTGATDAAGLKGNTDPELQDNLVDGFRHLEERIVSECNRPEETATPSPTATETPTEEPTATVTPSPTPTVTATPSPTATVAPTVTATPDDGTGGTGTEDDDGDDDSGGSSVP